MSKWWVAVLVPETPSPAVLRRLAEVLRLPVHHFLRPSFVATDGPLFYRSMATATKISRIRAETRFRWTREIIRFLRGFVDLPNINCPQLHLPNDPLAISQSDIEEAAAATRRHWKLGDGPISNVVLLLENNGTIIVRHDLRADKRDAFSAWSSEERTPYIVLNSSKGVAVRSRFDVAHELAHLILHRNIPPGCLNRSELFELVEEQAHSFARAFLLPPKTFAADLFSATLNSFRALKPKWKVSIQAMIFRAKDLNLLPPDQERRLWINLTRQGWKTLEPLDDTLEPETPRLLRRSVELMVSSGVTTPRDIVFQNALPAEDVEELLNLPTGFLAATGQRDEQGGFQPSIIRFPSTG